MKRLHEQGVSLLEVLVAIAIMGMLSVGLTGMMRQQNYIVRDSAEALSAQLKVNEVMETLKIRPFEQLKSYTSLVVSDFNPMTIEVVVSDVESDQDFKKILVSVTWLDRRGHDKHVTLTTLRSKYVGRPIEYSLRPVHHIVMNTAREGGETW